MDRILAVIPVHNRRETTVTILLGLRNMASPGFHLDALVIDDGSTDGTAAAILERFPDVRVEYGDGNLWWGGALNVGYRYALRHGYNYVYTLNDDNKLRDDTLKELYNAAKNNPGTVCGSVILRENGFIINAGFRFGAILGKISNPWKNQHYESIREDLIPCQTLSTRSTLIPSEVLTRGLFMDAKRFPHNYSDYDFFDTVRRNGFNIAAVKRSVVVSGESTSNFHYFIVGHGIREIVSSFLDTKYANNFKNQWNIASRNTNLIFALLRFLCFVSPSIAWFLMRCVLPHNVLEAVLTYFGKYQRSSVEKIHGR